MNLEAEINGLAPEKRAIVELEEIEKQPKLIKGGQMKDFQVGIPSVFSAVNPDHFISLAPRAVFPCLDA